MDSLPCFFSTHIQIAGLIIPSPNHAFTPSISRKFKPNRLRGATDCRTSADCLLDARLSSGSHFDLATASGDEFFGQDPFLSQGDLHRPDRTYRYTEAAAGALLGVEDHLHRRPPDEEGPGRAYTGAGPALKTFLVITVNPCRQALNLDPQTSEIIQPGLDIVFAAAFEFQDHHSFSLQEDIGLEDIKFDIILLHQLVNKRSITRIFWKSQYINLCEHVVILVGPGLRTRPVFKKLSPFFPQQHPFSPPEGGCLNSIPISFTFPSSKRSSSAGGRSVSKDTNCC